MVPRLVAGRVVVFLEVIDVQKNHAVGVVVSNRTLVFDFGALLPGRPVERKGQDVDAGIDGQMGIGVRELVGQLLELANPIREAFAFGPLVAMIFGSLNGPSEGLAVQVVLDHVLVGPGADRIGGEVFIALAGQHDDRQPDLGRSESFQNFETRDGAELVIEKEQINRFRFKPLDATFRIAFMDELELAVWDGLQGQPQQLSVIIVVVDAKDGLGWRLLHEIFLNSPERHGGDG